MEPTPDAPAPDAPAPDAADLDLVVKDPLVRGSLALFPLFSTSDGAPPYLTGPEAERLGVLRVAERPDGAVVEQLVVRNTGAWPLLLLEGETLVGAKQDRTLDRSVLVPAASVATIPVSCVEAGRWGAPRAPRRSARHAPTDLRRVRTWALASPRHAARKQDAVWDRIARYQADLAAGPPTGALEGAYEQRAPDTAALVDGLRPLPEQRGVAVAVGGAVRGLDWFDKPATLVAYWDGLTAGYALDALSAEAGEPPEPAAVEQIVDRVRSVAWTAVPNPGLGASFTGTAAGVVAHALRWSGAVVHGSAFVDDTDAPRVAFGARPIRRRGRARS